MTDDDFADAETRQDWQQPSLEAALQRRHPQISWVDARGAHALTIQGRTVAGSATKADLVVVDPVVSRLHAELDLRDDGLWIHDLGSKNGTFVQDLRVGAALVPNGARIRLGSTTLTVSYEGPATAVDLWPSETFGELRGASAAMRELFARLARLAPLDATVLIEGETGTGKELVARALHDKSARAGKPFVIVDCGAIPEALLESELFGHVRGAFTGAHQQRLGALDAADGGTVFLDEIGELPLAMQPKLLRALESRTIRRLGETEYHRIDVRFMSATHRDLRQMVNAGAFREDLYFRLATIPISIPPLRDRTEDIELLVRHFSRPDEAPSPELLRELHQLPWLGNVRELRNVVERASALGAAEALALSTRREAPAAAPGLAFDKPLRDVREELEREYLRRLVRTHSRDINAMAQAAGIDRTYVYRLIKKHEL